MREEIRKQSHCTAQCAFTCSWMNPGFSLSPFLPSTYLPETPFPGRWPSQFASSLNKHFTGERLDLHLPIASHHMRTNAYTHTHKQRTIIHTDMTASNLPLCWQPKSVSPISKWGKPPVISGLHAWLWTSGLLELSKKEEEDSTLGVAELNKCCMALCFRARGGKRALEHYVLYKSPDSQLLAS